MESATALGPFSAELHTLRAILGALTHGSRVPAAYKGILSINQRTLRGYIRGILKDVLGGYMEYFRDIIMYLGS